MRCQGGGRDRPAQHPVHGGRSFRPRGPVHRGAHQQLRWESPWRPEDGLSGR